MPSKNLDKIKSNRLYKLSGISKFNSDDKNLLVDKCILTIANKDDLVSIINNSTFNRSYYKSLYINRVIVDPINKQKKKINILQYYKEVNDKTSVLLNVKKNLSSYNKKNLYYNVYNDVTLSLIRNRNKSKSKVKYFLEVLEDHIKFISKYYSQIILFVPVNYDNATPDMIRELFDLTKLKGDVNQYFYNIFKYPELFDLLIKLLNKYNVDILFNNTATNTTFKLSHNEFNEEYSTKIHKKIIKRRNIYFGFYKLLIKMNNKSFELSEKEKTTIANSTLNDKDTVEDKEIITKNKVTAKTDELTNILVKEVVSNSATSNNSVPLSPKRKEIINNISIKINNQISSNKELLNKPNQEIVNKIYTNDKSVANDVKKLAKIDKVGESNFNQIEGNEAAKETVDNNEENFKEIVSVVRDKKTEERIDTLSKNQENIKISFGSNETKKTIKEYTEKETMLPLKDTSGITKAETVFNDTKHSALSDFDSTYMENTYESDIVKTLTAFSNDNELKLFVEDIKIENTSDEVTKKKTMTINFKDEKNVKHTVVMDIPIIKDGKYIYVNGSRKMIQKQVISKPITKVNPDRVLVTTDYNKFFVERFNEAKINNILEAIKKFFAKNGAGAETLDKKVFDATLGSAKAMNRGNKLPIEYDFLSSIMTKVILNNEYCIDFNYTRILSYITESKINTYKSTLPKFNDNQYTIIGYNTSFNQLIIINNETLVLYIVDKSLKPVMFNILNLYSENNLPLFSKVIFETLDKAIKNREKVQLEINNNVKTMFSRLILSNVNIPTGIVLGYELGLNEMLRRYKVNYSIINGRSTNIGLDKSYIKFKDCYLVYDNIIRNNLLLEGLKKIDTKKYDISEFDTNGIPYLEFFSSAYGSRNIGKGIHNNLSLMIDPKTKDILRELGQPTNIYNVILYCNTLLENNSCIKVNDMNNFRIRGAEQVNAIMYKIIADRFKQYKDTSRNNNPIKISVPQDVLIKELLSSKTVDEYSVLNPSIEIEKTGSCTWKGPSGMNSDHSYTKEIRSYSKSMEGIFGYSTPDSNKVGAVRQLSIDPAIVNTFGMIDTEKEKNQSTLFTTSEMLNPFTSCHADPPRIGFVSSQQKQLIPVKKHSKPLFGSGADKTLPYMLSDDFAFKAKYDGKIEKIENNIAIIAYNNGTKDTISLDTSFAKNSAGFYTNNKLDLVVKEGQSFKANDILAKNSSFFLGDNKNDIVYSMGTLAKVAMASSSRTLEDSSFIANSLSGDMTASLVMKKELVLGPHADIQYLAKEGIEIKTGDPLIVFENSYDDESINKMLSKLGDEFSETVDNLSRNTYRSKYTGKLVGVKILYNVDKEELSPSIQKYLNAYLKIANAKKKIIVTNSTEENIIGKDVPITEKQSEDRILNNVNVNGILIQFFIEVDSPLRIGDKITFYGGCKTIISDVLDDDKMPIAESRKDETITAVFSPLSVVSRMTIDIPSALYFNKILVELKRRVKDIYNK